MTTWFDDDLRTLGEQHLLRRRRQVAPWQAPAELTPHEEALRATTYCVDGQERLSFGSNDYLGLSQHPALMAAAHAAIDRYGVGATASPLVCGHSPEHEALEAELAALVGTLIEETALTAAKRDLRYVQQRLATAPEMGEVLERLGRVRHGPVIREALQGTDVPLHDAADMHAAVAQAAAIARSGDAVLMSPACASFDMFDNYGHRAEVFVQAVASLAEAAGVAMEGGL